MNIKIIYENSKDITGYVYPDLGTVLMVPTTGTTVDKISLAVKKHLGVILKKLNFFKKEMTLINQPGKKRYIARSYNIRIIYSQNEKVKLKQGLFFIYTSRPSSKKHNYNLLHLWSLEKGQTKLKEKDIGKINLFHCVRYSNYVQRLIINCSFIAYPAFVIDYMISCLLHQSDLMQPQNFHFLLKEKIWSSIKKDFCIFK